MSLLSRWTLRPDSAEPAPRLTLAGLDRPAAASRTLVLSRALYRVRRLPLEGIERAERLAALRLQAKAWQPFDQCEHAAHWEGDAAWLYAWDPRSLPARSAQLPPWQVLPECWLRPAPDTDGLRLVAALDGVEAEHWRGGQCVARRWWPAAVASQTEDWTQWLAAQGLAATPPAAQAESLPPLPRPRHAALPLHEARRAQGGGSAAGWVAVLLCGLTGAVGMSALQAHAALRSAQAEAQAAEPAQRRVQERVREARALAAQVQEISRPFEAVAPLPLLAHLDQVLPKGSQLRELDLQGQRLRLAVELPGDASRAAFLQALQSGGWLTRVNEVRADSGPRQWMRVEAQLSGWQPPPAAPRPASGPVRP